MLPQAKRWLRTPRHNSWQEEIKKNRYPMAQALTTGEYIQRRLRPMRARLRLGDTLLFASRTLWVGLAGFALVQIAGRLVPIPNLLLWSLLPPALWLLVILGYVLIQYHCQPGGSLSAWIARWICASASRPRWS